MTQSVGESAPPPTAGRRRTRLVLVLLAAVLVPTGAFLLYTVKPGDETWYPRCAFHVATGLHCPGCGVTRASHALLHGDLAQALAFNPMFVVALPLLLIAFGREVYHLWTGRRLGQRLPGWVILTIFWLILSFWVLRNVGVYPFTLLAPHEL
jgi:hypothetical protein